MPGLALVVHDRVVGEQYNKHMGIESGIGHDAADHEFMRRPKVIGVIGGTPSTIARTPVGERGGSRRISIVQPAESALADRLHLRDAS